MTAPFSHRSAPAVPAGTRIVHVVRQFLPNRGGLEDVVANLCRAQLALGLRVGVGQTRLAGKNAPPGRAEAQRETALLERLHIRHVAGGHQCPRGQQHQQQQPRKGGGSGWAQGRRGRKGVHAGVPDGGRFRCQGGILNTGGVITPRERLRVQDGSKASR